MIHSSSLACSSTSVMYLHYCPLPSSKMHIGYGGQCGAHLTKVEGAVLAAILCGSQETAAIVVWAAQLLLQICHCQVLWHS